MRLKSLTLAMFACLASSSFALVELTDGHIDLGLGYSGGVWDPHIHDEENDIEYEPDEAYFFYGANSQAARPAGSDWDFIGVGAGATIWRNYDIYVPNIPWLGFGFEEVANGTFGTFTNTDPRRPNLSLEWIDVRLLSFTAPTGGQVSFFKDTATPTVWFATSDGISASDKFIGTPGGHEHGSFAFTAAGIYTLTFQASALDKATGQRIFSDPYTYTFGVQQPVPEPGTLAALGLGAAALLRKRKRANR